MADISRGARDDERCAELVPCEHYYASRHKPGHRLYWVRQCMFCHEVDWDSLDAGIGTAVRKALLSLVAEFSRRQATAAHSFTANAYSEAARMAAIRADEAHAATAEPGPGEAEGRPPGERTGRLSATENPQ